MRKNAILLGIAAMGSVGAGVSSASPAFSNLDFEQAQIQNVSNTMGAFIQAGPALPVWTPTEGAVTSPNPVGQFPTASLPQATYIELVSTNTFENTSVSTPIAGNFSIELSAYGTSVPQIASITQTATVPTGTQTIHFLARDPSGGAYASTPTVSLNGTPIALVPLSNTAGIIEYAGDVSAFAGTFSTLTFAALASGPTQNVYDLDSISFSTALLPEPACLVVAPLLILATRRRSYFPTK